MGFWMSDVPILDGNYLWHFYDVSPKNKFKEEISTPDIKKSFVNFKSSTKKILCDENEKI